MNEWTRNILIWAGTLAFIAGASKGLNMIFNDRTIKGQSYNTESHSTGISGHVEYTLCKDGSRDVKIYPSFGHTMFSSELYQDLNGDGLVDRIRQEGPAMKNHSLKNILIRKFDYQQNKEIFDKADNQLSALMNEYAKGAK